MKRLALCLFCLCAFQLRTSAHVLDQYLQAAQIALAPGDVRIELRLIPGAQVADRVFTLIDIDGNGQLSPVEEQSYARRVLQDIRLEVDGRRATLALTGVEFPSRPEMNEGIGAIRLELKAETALDRAGGHQLTFRNDHLPELGTYLANALVPRSAEIKITGMQRDALQHSIQVDFQLAPPAARIWTRWAGVLLFGLCLMVLLLAGQWLKLKNLFHLRSEHNLC